MAWIGALIGGAASLIGSSMNASSVADTNAQSLEVNRENRDWAEQMSNTAEQRHVADLSMAGLNPALAYQTAPPVPGMPSNPSLSPPQPGAGLMNSAATLSQIPQAIASKNLMDAQTQKVQADTAATLSKTPQSAQDLTNTQRQQILLEKQILNAGVTNDKTVEEVRGLMNQNTNFEQMVNLRNTLESVNLQRAQLGLPRLENDAAWQKTHPGLAGWLSSAGGGSGGYDAAINAAKLIAK